MTASYCRVESIQPHPRVLARELPLDRGPLPVIQRRFPEAFIVPDEVTIEGTGGR